VVTDDLAEAMEEVSGQSLDKFFDEWVYHGHFPELEAHYSWDEETKMAKLTVRQTQKVTEDVLLFSFPLTVAFQGKNGETEKTVQVKDKESEFYFPLSEAPRSVVLDPRMDLLAKIDFSDFSKSMAYAALDHGDDLMGRLRAVEKLADSHDHASVEKLKHALQSDAFYGVRAEAASALRGIHNDESLDALLDSREQSDARVRQRVMDCIGGFYEGRAFDAEKAALTTEKNPDIEATEIQALGRSGRTDIRETLLSYLKSESYHNALLNAAIAAMGSTHDDYYLAPLMDTIKARQNEMTTRDFGSALDMVASLARDHENKDAPRELIAGFVNSKKLAVQTGAIHALGELEDPRAIPILETFANTAEDNPNRRSAARALEAIRSARKPVDNLKELRDAVADLQKENRKLRSDMDSMQKQLDAGAKSPKKKKT
jgi:aminopeptidase N